MHRYPDAYLDHWSDIYVSRRIRECGITLEQFLVAPHQMLARVERIRSSRYRQAEPVQHRHERRALAALTVRGAVLIQKFWRGSRHGSRTDVPRAHRK